MSWRRDSLPEIMTHLASRPGHEAVRADITDILRYGFAAKLDSIDHEVRMPEVRGRADTLFGATVFEFKSDLRQEIGDVRAKMPDYLGERERRTNRRFLGIATDGATFLAFELRDGILKDLGRHDLRADRPDADALLAWLSPALADRDDLAPEPLAYRHLSAELKPRLRDACQALDLWVGGHLATQQDVSALFWARCAQRYLKIGGIIAFVLPYAALNRPAFQGLRRGQFMRNLEVSIITAWSFDEQVRPLFPVPACVLIGKRAPAQILPDTVTRYSGSLDKRDAAEADANKFLKAVEDGWPPIPTLTGASSYRERFTNGATIYPRRLFIVERDTSGRLGSSRSAPRVRGKEGAQDKDPWKRVEPPNGPVETQFLRPVLLGENIAPYRILTPALGVVPIAGPRVLDSKGAMAEGYRHLAAWLRSAEEKWLEHCSRRADGLPTMTLLEQLDHRRKLSIQTGKLSSRVVYAKAGTLLSAAVLEDDAAVVDHMAYWANSRSVGEARYLTAIINSETVRERIAPMQPKGQGGARHFDNLVWELRIPEFSHQNALHTNIGAAAAVAERVAATVALTEGAYFTTHRRAIRDALAANGIAKRINVLVTKLLDGPIS